MTKISKYVVMSSSLNFPSWAEPSYNGSEPSWAGASQFSGWKRAVDFFLMYCSSSPNFFSVLLLQTSEPENQSFKKKKYYSLQRKLKVEWQVFWKCKEIRKKMSGKKCKFLAFRAEIKFSSWRKKATSRAKLKILQLGSDSSLKNSIQEKKC